MQTPINININKTWVWSRAKYEHKLEYIRVIECILLLLLFFVVVIIIYKHNTHSAGNDFDRTEWRYVPFLPMYVSLYLNGFGRSKYNDWLYIVHIR